MIGSYQQQVTQTPWAVADYAMPCELRQKKNKSFILHENKIFNPIIPNILCYRFRDEILDLILFKQ